MKEISEIKPGRLRELYWEQEKSSPEIAEIYNCSAPTVRYWMKKYGIDRRSKSEARDLAVGIDLSKQKLKKLYLEQEMSSPEIAEELNCSASFIRKKLREFNIPIRSYSASHLLCNQPEYERCEFNGDLVEKAYLIGFREGDLYVETTSSRSIVISVNTTKKAQLRVFRKMFSEYGHINTGNVDSNGAISIRTYLNKKDFKFLIEKKNKIPSWILKKKDYFASFVAGYTDAEGSFCLVREHGVFSIRTQDKKILHQIRKKLVELEIFLRPPKLTREKGDVDNKGIVSNDNVWGIWVYRKNALLKLIDLIGPFLKHAGRQEDMKMVKNNIDKRNKKYNRKNVGSRWDKLYKQEI